MIPLPIHHNEIQARRAGRRAGLHYFINEWGQVPDGDPWEKRDATDFEKEMWLSLTDFDFPLRPPQDRDQECPSLDALQEELESIYFWTAATLNAEDFAVLRRLGLEGLTFNTDRRTLQEGLLAYWEREVCHDEGGSYTTEKVKKTLPVYVNRMVPKGYYLRQALKVWRPSSDERVLAPILDDMELLKLSSELYELNSPQ